APEVSVTRNFGPVGLLPPSSLLPPHPESSIAATITAGAMLLAIPIPFIIGTLAPFVVNGLDFIPQFAYHHHEEGEGVIYLFKINMF
ncbi:MAG: hypothetical protein ACXW4I_10510, partial [Candidatus Deferrimicrobiaceae bacterium]